MGVGAAIGAVSGISNIIGSSKQDKAAKEAAALSAEQMAMAKEQMRLAAEQMGKGEEYIKKMEDQLDSVNEQLKLGEVDIDQARALFNQSLDEYGFARESLSGLDQMWSDAQTRYDESMSYLGEGRELASGVSDMFNMIGEEYKQFGNQMWQDWEETFGDLRENVVSYYNDLDPEKYAMGTKANIQDNLDKSLQQFDETMAQSGIYTSGMKAQAMKDMQFEKAKAFAQADLSAEDQVANMQAQAYGQLGEPYRQQAQQMQGQGIMNQAQMAQMGLMPQLGVIGDQSKASQQYGNLFGQQGNQLLQRGSMYGNLAGATGQVGNQYTNLAQYPLQQSQIMQGVANGYGNAANIYGNYAGNYMQGAGQYQNMGQTYANSAAGYGQASGELFGRGMNQLGSLFGGTSGGIMGLF